jgi:hypothetical protein
MKPIEEYRQAIAKAAAFKHEHPIEKQITGARIYHVNPKTVDTNLRRARERGGAPAKQHGGHNKVLSDSQVMAIYKYVEDSYLGGYGATKAMVFAAISHLKASQIPPQKAPSWRWFQTFIKAHPDLFRTLKTKPIARVRVSTADIEEVTEWFKGFTTWCKEHEIGAADILNFDEAGFRVGVAPSEDIIVPAYVKEVSIVLN